MQDFSKSIVKWYKKNHRELPWRSTCNPYYIWISEIILQQTRVDQGLSYYEKFIKEFPTVNDLADADEQRVLKIWQGLGYYSRARNLHFSAKEISTKFKGIFPKDYVKIRSLKGVGDYTAAAIASFCFGLPYAVVDGNVYRLLSRVFNISEPIDKTSSKKIFSELAKELLDEKDPGTHNQAMMELGATICKPADPLCNECPLSTICIANQKGIQLSLPVKAKKQKQKNRYLEYIVHHKKNSILLKKREEKDIWLNLFDFPSIEMNTQVDLPALAETNEWKRYFKRREIHVKHVSKTYKHILSHQVIHARFWTIEHTGELNIGNAQYIALGELDQYPVPRLIDEYLKENV